MGWIKEELMRLREGMEVVVDEERLKEYSYDRMKKGTLPVAAVFPESSEDIQKLIRWANEREVPLIPVSSGSPRSRGDTVPEFGGVVVDMRKMKKILKIDRRNRVCLVEAGVTFEELIPTLREEGLRLNMPLSPRKNKSVLTSALEREPPLMPRYQWDASDPLLCLEVIFGSGDLFRTGEASGPGGPVEQWKIGGAQKFPLGPHQVDYFRLVQGAQGTMGIVTWASIKCELLPSHSEFFFICSDGIHENTINFLYRLLRLDLVDEMFILNRKNAEVIAFEGEKVNGLPSFLVFLGVGASGRFAGERMGYKVPDLMDTAQRYGVRLTKNAGPLKGREFAEKIYSPSEGGWRAKGGNYREIFFITTLNAVPFFVKEFSGFLSSVRFEGEAGIYIQPLVQGTSCHLEFTIYGDVSEELIDKMSEFLFERGAFFSRPYGKWAEMVYSRNTVFTESLKKVKRIFDPNGIMNPGKLCF